MEQKVDSPMNIKRCRERLDRRPSDKINDVAKI